MDTISGATQLSVRLTKKELADAHSKLMRSPLGDDGSRYASLERFGVYEVRLCQTLGQASEDAGWVPWPPSPPARDLQADTSPGVRLSWAYNNRGETWRAKGDIDRAIADYTEAIRLDPKNSNAYLNRGLVWDNKDDIERAAADYNEAIRLDPKNANAYNNRGTIWADRGDIERAVADYNEAIRLDPKHANAYKNRGRLFFHNGDFDQAAADLLRANNLQDNAYNMLWRYLARGRLKQDGAAELSAYAAQLKSKDWPYAVIDFYLGRRTLAEMRSAAAKPDQKCEAEFYIAEWRLLMAYRRCTDDNVDD